MTLIVAFRPGDDDVDRKAECYNVAADTVKPELVRQFMTGAQFAIVYHQGILWGVKPTSQTTYTKARLPDDHELRLYTAFARSEPDASIERDPDPEPHPRTGDRGVETGPTQLRLDGGTGGNLDLRAAAARDRRRRAT